jgi:ABC-type polysaccharide/polyol phosphate transport system ATPase subunit
MDEFVIRVSQLKKKYQLYTKPFDRLKEVLHPLRKSYHKDFYALKDLSFEIKKGQSVGIIGKNGSGKSTLLKILTGIVAPTSGKVEVVGRVAALLELGAGFNPDLTGLENIYLSGALNGYSQQEMTKLLPDVLDFADIGNFIHQPVRIYSSGMFARLAFAIAVSVDPDILIVDEALSVGDIRFQQKCIRRMKAIRDSGRTVIFVSHDVALLSTFCDFAIWIHEGIVKESGRAKEIVNLYTSFMAYALEPKLIANKTSSISLTEQSFQQWWPMLGERLGSGMVEIRDYRFIVSGKSVQFIKGGEDVEMQVQYEVLNDIEMPILGVMFRNRLGVLIFGINNRMYNHDFGSLCKGHYIGSMNFKMPLLGNGDYTISFSIADGTQATHEQLQWIHDGIAFQVMNPEDKYNIGALVVIDKVHFSNSK